MAIMVFDLLMCNINNNISTSFSNAWWLCVTFTNDNLLVSAIPFLKAFKGEQQCCCREAIILSKGKPLIYPFRKCTWSYQLFYLRPPTFSRSPDSTETHNDNVCTACAPCNCKLSSDKWCICNVYVSIGTVVIPTIWCLKWLVFV